MKTAIAIVALVITTCSYANSGHLANQYYRYKHLCSMIPECAAEQEAKREDRRRRKLEREVLLSTPSQPKPRIPEWAIMEEKLGTVKILRRNND